MLQYLVAKSKILFIGAMDREIRQLLQYFQCIKKDKIKGIYPFWLSKKNNLLELAVVQSFVGDTNACISAALTIQKFRPDFVFKIGCVGGNSKGLHTGDILLPLGFFHSGSWITRSNIDNSPTSDASLWQSVFGEKPYQVSKDNLGNRPYFLKPDQRLANKFKQYFTQQKVKLKPCYIGGGNIWFFDLKFMENVAEMQIPGNNKLQPWGADMESYSIAQVCNVFAIPFLGFYRISNSDYYNEPYQPENVAKLFDFRLISLIDKFLRFLL